MQAGGISQRMLFRSSLPLWVLNPTETILLAFWNVSGSPSVATAPSQACLYLSPSQWSCVCLYMYCKIICSLCNVACVAFPAVGGSLLHSSCFIRWICSQICYILTAPSAFARAEHTLCGQIFGFFSAASNFIYKKMGIGICFILMERASVSVWKQSSHEIVCHSHLFNFVR